MNLIVAVDNSWGIGYNGNLLYSIPLDMQFFKDTTKNKIVVMGSNTLKSLPGGKPLKNRINIVLSEKKLEAEGAIVFNNLKDVLNYVKQFNSDDVFVIGGAYVYQQFLPYCKYAFITKINSSKQADKFFPNVDEMKNWKLIEKSQDHFCDDIKFNFCKYENHGIRLQ